MEDNVEQEHSDKGELHAVPFATTKENDQLELEEDQQQEKKENEKKQEGKKEKKRRGEAQEKTRERESSRKRIHYVERRCPLCKNKVKNLPRTSGIFTCKKTNKFQL